MLMRCGWYDKYQVYIEHEAHNVGLPRQGFHLGPGMEQSDRL